MYVYSNAHTHTFVCGVIYITYILDTLGFYFHTACYLILSAIYYRHFFTTWPWPGIHGMAQRDYLKKSPVETPMVTTTSVSTNFNFSKMLRLGPNGTSLYNSSLGLKGALGHNPGSTGLKFGRAQ